MRELTIVLAGAALVSAQPASADVVTDWWDVANRYFNAGQGAPGPRTPDMERASTRTALAMFEAANAIDRRYQSYLNLAAGDHKASQDAGQGRRHPHRRAGGAGGDRIRCHRPRRSAGALPAAHCSGRMGGDRIAVAGCLLAGDEAVGGAQR
jgi:hypothetical protein